MAVKALAGSGVLYDERRRFYLSENTTKELWTDVAPFTTVAANRNIITGLADPLFKLFEHRDPWIKQECFVNATTNTMGNDDLGDAIDVDNITGLASPVDSSWIGLIFEVWDSTRTTKRGQVLVTAVSSATLTVKLLSTTAFATVDNDVMVCIGNAQGEGSSAPEAWSDELRVVWGCTQMLETAIEITGSLYAASLRGYNKELERLRMQKHKEHRMQNERSALFGSSVIGTGLDPAGAETFSDTARTNAAGQKVRTSMGIITAIERYGISSTTHDDQNIFSIPEATYKYSNFVDDMEKVFHYYPDGGVKYAFAGPGAMSYWSKMDGSAFLAGKSGWQVKLSESMRDSLGFNVRMMETPHGILALVPTPALRGPYNKHMVVVSDDNLKLVQFQKPEFKVNVKTDNAYKGEKDVYFTDQGLGMTLIESHKLFKIV